MPPPLEIANTSMPPAQPINANAAGNACAIARNLSLERTETITLDAEKKQLIGAGRDISGNALRSMKNVIMAEGDKYTKAWIDATADIGNTAASSYTPTLKVLTNSLHNFFSAADKNDCKQLLLYSQTSQLVLHRNGEGAVMFSDPKLDADTVKISEYSHIDESCTVDILRALHGDKKIDALLQRIEQNRATYVRNSILEMEPISACKSRSNGDDQTYAILLDSPENAMVNGLPDPVDKSTTEGDDNRTPLQLLFKSPRRSATSGNDRTSSLSKNSMEVSPQNKNVPTTNAVSASPSHEAASAAAELQRSTRGTSSTAALEENGHMEMPLHFSETSGSSTGSGGAAPSSSEKVTAVPRNTYGSTPDIARKMPVHEASATGTLKLVESAPRSGNPSTASIAGDDALEFAGDSEARSSQATIEIDKIMQDVCDYQPVDRTADGATPLLGAKIRFLIALESNTKDGQILLKDMDDLIATWDKFSGKERPLERHAFREDIKRRYMANRDMEANGTAALEFEQEVLPRMKSTRKMIEAAIDEEHRMAGRVRLEEDYKKIIENYDAVFNTSLPKKSLRAVLRTPDMTPMRRTSRGSIAATGAVNQINDDDAHPADNAPLMVISARIKKSGDRPILGDVDVTHVAGKR